MAISSIKESHIVAIAIEELKSWRKSRGLNLTAIKVPSFN
jgi:hypothetical protein